MQGRDAQSRQAFLRALELNPNYATAMSNFSVLDTWLGHLDEAVDSGTPGVRPFGKARGNDFYHLIVPLLSIRADAGDP